MIEGVPEGGAVTLPREAVARWLEEAADGPKDAAHSTNGDVADLTVTDLAEALDRSESTVRGWLPDVPGSYKLGQEWRVPRDAWRAYLDGLAAKSEEGGPPEVRSRPGAALGDWREERRAS
jgi:hypothetical protein